MSQGSGALNEHVARREPVADAALPSATEKASPRLRIRVAPGHIAFLLIVAIAGLYLVNATPPVPPAIVRSDSATRPGPPPGGPPGGGPPGGQRPSGQQSFGPAQQQQAPYGGLMPQAPFGAPQQAPYGGFPQQAPSGGFPPQAPYGGFPPQAPFGAPPQPAPIDAPTQTPGDTP